MIKNKGIVLAGGSGSRLYPITKSCIKQLLPIYDKPMIYYPISLLMLADIREIMIITNKEYLQNYQNLLGNGENFGIHITYAIQKEPRGIAESLIIADEFLNGDRPVLILGDNIFFGSKLPKKIKDACAFEDKATIFCFPVSNPEQFGIINFDKSGKPLSIIEKPSKSSSNLAVTGLYVYDSKATEYAKQIKSSDRGELEITELNNIYLKNNQLRVEKLMRGNAWFDAGTFASLYEASSFIKSVQDNQSFNIGFLEEIAFNNGWINKEQLIEIADSMQNNEYGKYLKKLSQ